VGVGLHRVDGRRIWCICRCSNLRRIFLHPFIVQASSIVVGAGRMFLHGQGVLLQVHCGGSVAVVVGGCCHSGCRVAVGSIAGCHGCHTRRGISPCYVAYHHGVVL
jgi:hypothetical protein